MKTIVAIGGRIVSGHYSKKFQLRIAASFDLITLS